MIFFKKLDSFEKEDILYKKENNLFEKENKHFFQKLTEDQKALIINFIKVENTGKTIDQWDDSVIAMNHREVVYDGGIKATFYNSKLTLSSNNTEIVFKAYDSTGGVIYTRNGFDRLYNIKDQIEQGKITVEKSVIEKAEKMFKSDNDKETNLEKNNENTEKIQDDSSNDYDYNDIE